MRREIENKSESTEKNGGRAVELSRLTVCSKYAACMHRNYYMSRRQNSCKICLLSQSLTTAMESFRGLPTGVVCLRLAGVRVFVQRAQVACFSTLHKQSASEGSQSNKLHNRRWHIQQLMTRKICKFYCVNFSCGTLLVKLARSLRLCRMHDVCSCRLCACQRAQPEQTACRLVHGSRH